MAGDYRFLERATVQNIAKFIKDDDVHIYTSTPTLDLYADCIENIEKMVRENIENEEQILALLKKIDGFYLDLEELAFLCGMRAGAKLLLDLLHPHQ